MGLGNWLRNRPRGLDRMYPGAKWLFSLLDPIIKRIGYDRTDRWVCFPEELAKEIVFGCRMCGQCILHSTGLTCPMTCPKELRNGSCGGVQMNGKCEVNQIGRYVWVDAYERSRKMHRFGDDIADIQPPVNRRLLGSSAWINMLNQKDDHLPCGWVDIPKITVSSADRR